MTGGADAAEDLRAAGHELVPAPGSGPRLGASGLLRLLLVEPVLEVRLGQGLEHDGHEAVADPAQLGALAAVGARPIDARPGLVDKPGDGVLLPAEVRNPPRMDDVVGRGQEADLSVDRRHERPVHLSQIVLVLWCPALRGVLARRKGAEEADPLIQIIIAPAPLVARNLDGQVGVAGVGHGPQDPRRGNGHGDQDENGDQGPEELQNPIAVEPRRDRARGLAVAHDGVAHGGEHHQADGRTDLQDQHVQRVDLLADSGDARGQIQGVVRERRDRRQATTDRNRV